MKQCLNSKEGSIPIEYPATLSVYWMHRDGTWTHQDLIDYREECNEIYNNLRKSVDNETDQV